MSNNNLLGVRVSHLGDVRGPGAEIPKWSVDMINVISHICVFLATTCQNVSVGSFATI